MHPPAEPLAIPQIVERLGELTEAPAVLVAANPDAVVSAGAQTFAVEWKAANTVASITQGAEHVKRLAPRVGADAVPLLAVPYMGPAGQEICKQAEVSWLDLSGNARIWLPGLHIRILGHEDRFRRPGRPSTAFAPKSARVARDLLIHAGQWTTQREIAQRTGLSEGLTSRTVNRLKDVGLIQRRADGRIQARDPSLLLDAWEEQYLFSRHRILRGHVAARSSDAALRGMVAIFAEQGQPYAATGLAAAWLLTRFAGFRIVTLYVEKTPTPELLDRLSFREEERGANVWLVVPNDEGVFCGAVTRDGIRCVHPVQVYLDLKGHPERAREAAQKVRAECLQWSTNA